MVKKNGGSKKIQEDKESKKQFYICVVVIKRKS